MATVLCDKCIGTNIFEQYTVGHVIRACEICGCNSCARGLYRVGGAKLQEMKEGFSSANLSQIKKLEHQLALVSTALTKCILAAGFLREDISELSGPELLMFSEDLCEILRSQNKELVPVWVDVAERTRLAETVYDAIRREIPIGPWKSLDADTVQRIVDSIRKIK